MERAPRTAGSGACPHTEQASQLRGLHFCAAAVGDGAKLHTRQAAAAGLQRQGQTPGPGWGRCQAVQAPPWRPRLVQLCNEACGLVPLQQPAASASHPASPRAHRSCVLQPCQPALVVGDPRMGQPHKRAAGGLQSRAEPIQRKAVLIWLHHDRLRLRAGVPTHARRHWWQACRTAAARRQSRTCPTARQACRKAAQSVGPSARQCNACRGGKVRWHGRRCQPGHWWISPCGMR